MRQYLFDQTLTDNSNSKQMYHKLEQVLYYINKIPLSQNQMVLGNQDQDDQWDFIPRNSPKLSKITLSMTKNSWELCADYVVGLTSSKGQLYLF